MELVVTLLPAQIMSYPERIWAHTRKCRGERGCFVWGDTPRAPMCLCWIACQPVCLWRDT